MKHQPMIAAFIASFTMAKRWFAAVMFMSLCGYASANDGMQSSLKPSLKASLVIIIDDLGYSLTNGLNVVALPGDITLAVLPHTPHGSFIAMQGSLANKEIMLHAPMENHAGLRLGKGGLTLNMEEQVFKQMLRSDISSVSMARGLNNHMGSALTENEQSMQWTMEVAKELGLYFVDSRTSAASVALTQALKYKVPALERDVFLDNDTATQALEIQFNKAMKIALKYGSAVLIGHPYPATTAFLAGAIPRLKDAGIELVSASVLIEQLKPHLNTL